MGAVVRPTWTKIQPKMQSLVLLLGLAALTQAAPSSDLLFQEWQLFKKVHNKVYPNATEEMRRMGIFFESKAFINDVNGKTSFYLGINHLADMHLSEVTSAMVPSVD